tara:strand:+ start:13525 stop:15534 length:2010 start_codon:yes stop_codon:yes gene_type:complete
MANYNKSFNFRNGVQVDNNNFVVNANGLVGIGTSIPSTFLDVHGNSELRGDVTVSGEINASGLVTSTQLYVNGQSELEGQLDVTGITTFGSSVSVGSSITIGTGVTIEGSNGQATFIGVVTASKFVGDGGSLSNIIGFSTQAWILDRAINAIDPLSGLATVTSIGIGTTQANALYDLVIGQDPNDSKEGISFDGSTGNIRSSGIITATTFSGPLTGAVTGSVTGNVTGDVTGNISGVAGTFLYSDTTNLEVTGLSTFTGAIDANGNLDVDGYTELDDLNVSGISTFIGLLNAKGDVSLGDISTDTILVGARFNSHLIPKTDDSRDLGSSALQWKDLYLSGVSSSATLRVNQGFAEIINTTGVSTVSIGQSVGVGNSSAGLRFGNPSKNFDIINYDNGNVNTFIDLNEVGLSTGNFRWIHKNSNVRMTLTYDGNLGIGEPSPEHKLHVAGISTFEGAAHFESGVTVDGTLTAQNFSPSQITNATIINNSGISTYYNLNATNFIGINSSIPISGFDAQDATGYLNAVGINTISLYGNTLAVDGNAAFTGTLGIGTTALSNIGYGALGAFQVHGGDVLINNGSLLLNNDTSSGSSIGIGTTTPLCAVDFSQAGAGIGTNAYMLPPKITTPQRDGTGGNVGLSTVSGALIYNTTTSKLQVYNGTAWETITSST